MVHEDPLAELWQTKERISEQFSSARALVAEADRIANQEPLPRAGAHRKMIEGFPRGQSVGDPDPVMEELREIRSGLLKEAGGDLSKVLERANREAPGGATKASGKSPKKGATHRPFRGSRNRSTKA